MQCKYRIKQSVKHDFKEGSKLASVFLAIFASLGVIGYVLALFEIGLADSNDKLGQYMIVDTIYYIVNGFLVTALFLIVAGMVGVILNKIYEGIKGMFEECPDYKDLNDAM